MINITFESQDHTHYITVSGKYQFKLYEMFEHFNDAVFYDSDWSSLKSRLKDCNISFSEHRVVLTKTLIEAFEV